MRTYRGVSASDPNERVTAVLYPDGTFQAQATTGKLVCWHIPDRIDVSKQITGDPGTDEGKSYWPGAVLNRSPANGPFEKFPPSRPLMRAQLAGDITNLCVKNLGDVESAIAYAEWQSCVADEIYVRSFLVSIEMTDVIVRKDPFYTGDKAGQILKPFREYWKTREAKGNWDYVSGFTANGDGLAYVGSPFSVGPLPHELGHSFNMAHSIFGVDMQNPVCHDRTLVHLEKRKLYSSFDAARKPAGKYPYRVHPYTAPDIAVTHPNEPVVVPVLANDWDSNGKEMRLKSFTQKTLMGGTVTVKKVTPKFPQDPGEELLYTPAADYVGKDAIVYTVQNRDGLYTSEVAHVYVIDEESSLAAHWPLDKTSARRSENLIQKDQVALLPAVKKSVPGKVGKAIEIGPEESIVCGDVKILPKRPAGLMPGYKPKWGWYPLEEEIGNLFDPLDRSFSAAFWFRISKSAAGSGTRPGSRPAGNGNKNRPVDGTDGRTGIKIEDAIFSKLDEDIGDAVGFRITAANDLVQLFVQPFHGIKARKDSFKLEHQKKLAPGTWYHLAMVIDRDKNLASIWIDGKKSKRDLKIPPKAFIFSGRSDLLLRSPAGAATAFDDLRLAYRVFGGDEIKNLAAGK